MKSEDNAMIGNITIQKTTSLNYPVKSLSSPADFTQPANEENFSDAMVKESLFNAPESNSVSKETTSAPKSHLTLHGYTASGNDFTLEWGEDILVAVGGIGGSVNVKYHESSTEEDPVVIAWGTDSNGSAYKQLIHLNDVNPNHASLAEILALRAHLAKSGHQDVANGSGILWTALGSFDVNQKTDFEKYYKEWIAAQQLAHHESQAALYKLELERLLFYHHQNDNQNDKKEHFLSA